MKSIISTLALLFVVVSTSFAQGIYYAFPKYDSVVTFEFGSQFTNSVILDTSSQNHWQIGKPEKVVFDTAYEGARAIVTDTTQTSVPGDTSIFYARFSMTSVYPWASTFNGIGFIHKLDADSGSIANVEQLFIDRTTGGDSVWVSVVDTPFYYKQWKYCDTPTLMHNTDGWDTVTAWLYGLYIDQDIAGRTHMIDDSVLFRFTYISNDTSLAKDGWMIDYIWPNYMFYGSVADVKKNIVSIHPNPSNGSIYIKAETQLQCKGLTIIDALGKVVYKLDKLPMDGHLNLDLANGIYLLQYYTDRGVDTEEILIQR